MQRRFANLQSPILYELNHDLWSINLELISSLKLVVTSFVKTQPNVNPPTSLGA